MTIKDITKFLSKSRAFMTQDGKTFLNGGSLRQAVARELKRPDLEREIEVTEKIHKNGFKIKLYRRRPPGLG